MGVGFRLTPKWGFPIQSHFVTNSPSRFSSYYVRGREASINPIRLSFLSVVSEEGDILYKCPLNMHVYSAALQTLENDCLQMEGVKMSVDNRILCGMIDDTKISVKEDNFTPHIGLRERKTSQFSLLLENLDILEKSFADSDAWKLEKDILLQLGRLGALKLFHTSLSRTLKTSNVLDLSDVPTENIGECKINVTSDDHMGKIIVRSRKKEERKFRRQRVSLKNCNKVTSLSLPSKTIRNVPGNPTFSSAEKTSNYKSRRLMIARNEAEMSRGVKVVSNLERIKTRLEEETGQAVSLSCWAKAAGLDEKVLQQYLCFGWYCRDELIRSTRSLILYLARNYRGLGIALEDLLQAGNLGVLQGAERFDHTRGYRFSTYVRYWIRKSMSKIVAQHARGIQIPCTLSQAINQMQKAQKALSNGHGKYPGDDEIAKFTGLSLAKIESANKCLRVVGSIDQKMRNCLNAKYLDFIPDMAIQNPEEAVTRQHMRKDIYNLLRGLDPRERQVMVLRYGFKDHQPKSLAEIARLFHVSKESVRKIEKKATKRLRDGETRRNLKHYMNL